MAERQVGSVALGGDTSQPLVAPPLFRLIVRLEQRKAVRLQYCFSLLWLTFESEGREPERVSRMAERCAVLALPRLRGTDVMTLLAPDTVAVLLIDADPYAVGRIVQRLSESWAPGAAAGNGDGVSWSAGAACYPRDGFSVDALLESAERRRAWARIEGGNRVDAGLV